MMAVQQALEAQLAKKFELIPDAGVTAAVKALHVETSVNAYCNGLVLLALKEKLQVDLLIAPTLVSDHWFFNEEFVEDQQVIDGDGNITSEPAFAYHSGHELTIATMVAGVDGFYSQYFWNTTIDDRDRPQTIDNNRALLGRNVAAKALRLWSKPKKSRE
jgi:hypothetical protein